MDRRILVVDDNPGISAQICKYLQRPGLELESVRDGTTALEQIVDGQYSLVLTELKLPGIDGLDLIREIHQRSVPVSVVVMTGHATIESAVEAIKLGACDYLYKPIDLKRLGHVVEQALSHRRLQDEVESLRRSLEGTDTFHNLVGSSPRMRDLFARLSRVASTSCTVLITGETGTGKELVAEAIHACDPTRSGPLIAVNCAALPETLLESELFGHERRSLHGR